MNINEITKSKGFKVAVLAVGIFFIAFACFAAGVLVGLKKARYSYNFGENYERNFIGGRPGFRPMGLEGPGSRGGFPDFGKRDFRNAHGIAGTIVSVADNKIVLKDRDGQENTITVTDKTLIKNGQDTISINDLKNDDHIVVMGRPGNDGTVNADLIRVFVNNQ